MPHRVPILASAALSPAPRRQPKGILPGQTPRLSVVIVNYCQWENTEALVRQMLASDGACCGAVEVVVVDNHSPRHPLAARMRRWPGVSLRRWGRNRGFARAVNEGCRLSRGKWILLLNPDVTVTEGFLDGVLSLADQLFDADTRAGIVGFQMLDSDGARQMSAGSFPTLPGTLAGLMLPRGRRKYLALQPHKRRRVPWVSGCCLLVRRECLQELGGLDESFFLYYEDVDLCRRARLQGWSVWYEPALRAVHHAPLHRRQVPPSLRLITRHALLTYCKRHWPGWQCSLMASIVRLEAWARRRWASCRGDAAGADIFEVLGCLARDVGRGKMAGARRRLEMAVRGGDPRAH
jgi:N-acetylglucosaminyl-diphospho-decaprenol L-rhamnosyltransferase